ncbi:MAG: hypothetical protein A3H96_09585 [Acidobacteria bacterium RIFCSPLOWO2_02_FULL_67_36]|nr:MAG: hypothetical protein A3H96_09585 [Acidobacteria bacterium RIFCSPLOWO2_02_FULL_67_36]OFW24978.1 MAG: hypothetical protein A3G21_16155 [Acidobacteria bacterium RIFCSPLOWO2_12_FULL_66_21]
MADVAAAAAHVNHMTWALAIALVLVPLATGGAGGKSAPFSREAYVMGTRVTLTTWDSSRVRGLARLEQLLQPIEATDRQLSTWRSDSEVSRLNAAGAPFRLSPSLCALLTGLERWTTASDSAFDPAIGALSLAWGIHTGGRLPSASVVAAAQQASGWQRLGFDAARCTIAKSADVALDVGGFGKGEALDRARAAVSPAEAWLIDLGGQVAVNLAPPGRVGWPVGIAHPQRRQKAALILEMSSGSIATSAGSERDLYADGRRISHILDPRTGRPATFTGSVTVWHDDALAADALSTALFVMGPERGLRWAEAHAVAACYLIPTADSPPEVRSSSAFTTKFPRLRKLAGRRGTAGNP